MDSQGGGAKEGKTQGLLRLTMATRPWVISLSRQRRTSETVAPAERPRGSQGPSKGPPQPGMVSRSEEGEGRMRVRGDRES